MSTKRKGDWTPKGKGPNGRNLCYCGCGREVPTGKRTTFEAACYRNWAAKNDPATQRRLVEARDKGVCAACGVDTKARHREVQETKQLLHWLARRHAEQLMAQGELQMFPGFTKSAKRYAAHRIATDQAQVTWSDAYSWAEYWTSEELKERFGEYASVRGHTWEADHILPVIEGGGECDLSNLRTLCLPCHHKATADLARRRAERRRKQKQPELVLT